MKTNMGVAAVLATLALAGCSDDGAQPADGGAGGSTEGGAGAGGGGGGDIGGAPSCEGTDPAGDPELTAAMAALELFMEDNGIRGGAFAVVRQGEIVGLGASGSKTGLSCDPITPDTLFRVTSASELITTLAALDAVEDGALTLDESLVDAGLVPTLEAENADASAITLHHLLTQTSTYYMDSDHWWVEGACTSLADNVANAENPVLYGTPGTMYHTYIKSSFEVAALALENAADGQSFPEIVQERVLTPLGMSGSYDGFVAEEGDYSFGAEETPPKTSCRNRDPSESLHASVSDMAKLLVELTSSEPQVLEPDMRDRMLYPQGPHFWTTDNSTYGASVWHPFNDYEIYTDSIGYGFGQATRIYRDRGLAVIVLLNANAGPHPSLAFEIAKIYDPTLGAGPIPEQWDPDPDTLESFVGEYIDPLGFKGSGPRTLTLEHPTPTTLTGKFGADGEETDPLPFEPIWSDHNFVVETGGQTPFRGVRVWTDEVGAPYAVSLDADGGPPFYRVPTK